MSRCALNRWGPGTTCERPINTESAKELQSKIAAIKAERDKQDSIWTQAASEIPQTDLNNLNTKKDTILKK